jgi:hypothetical protein
MRNLQPCLSRAHGPETLAGITVVRPQQHTPPLPCKSIGNWHGSLYYLTHFLVQLLTSQGHCPTYMKKEAAGNNKFSLQAFYRPF